MMRSITLAVLFSTVACSSETVAGSGGSGTGGAPLTGGAASDGGGGSGTTDGGDGPGGAGDGAAGSTFDCSQAPLAAVSETILEGGRGYHGLAIDGSGLIYGAATDGSIVRSDYSGSTIEPFTGNLSLSQLEFLPTGDLAIAGDGVQKISPDGQVTSLAFAGTFPYGLRVGPDGMIYASGYDGLFRVHPDTGESTLLATVPNAQVNAFDFSEDFREILIGTIGNGELYSLALDEQMNPAGSPEIVAQVGSWHDGIAVDACGNAFVVSSGDYRLYRVSPDGQMSLFLDWSADSSQYGHGAVFGNGKGGFREDALYLPMPFSDNRVKEVVVGVPSRSWNGTVVNAPQSSP